METQSIGRAESAHFMGAVKRILVRCRSLCFFVQTFALHQCWKRSTTAREYFCGGKSSFARQNVHPLPPQTLQLIEGSRASAATRRHWTHTITPQLRHVQTLSPNCILRPHISHSDWPTDRRSLRPCPAGQEK